MPKITIPVSAFVVLEGKSKKGEDYAFVKIERKWANNGQFIADLKSKGAQVNGGNSNEQLDYEIS